MNTNFLAIAFEMPDDALLAKVKLLAQRSREVAVELIAHLDELGVRKLRFVPPRLGRRLVPGPAAHRSGSETGRELLEVGQVK